VGVNPKHLITELIRSLANQSVQFVTALRMVNEMVETLFNHVIHDRMNSPLELFS
jgi:hypothetical protein